MFGHEQEQADKVAAEAVGEGLPHAGFEGGGIARPEPALIFGGLGIDGSGGGLGAKLIEFFFEGRSRR